MLQLCSASKGNIMTTVTKKKLVAADTVKYVKYSEAKPGQTLVVGKFLGTKQVKKFNGKEGETVPLHTFNTDEGEIALNSASSLNRILDGVEPGTTLEVVFLGKESKQNKDGIKYRENTFEVNELTEEVPA